MKRYLLTLALCAAIVTPLLTGCGQETESEVALPPGELATTELTVEGMFCHGCAATITQTLSRLDGVSECEVTYEDKTATITYDPTKVSPERLMAAVTEIDETYSASLKTDSDPEPEAAAAATLEPETEPAEQPVTQ